MKNYRIKIVGLTPYMQHRMDDLKLEAWEKRRDEDIEHNIIRALEIAEERGSGL